MGLTEVTLSVARLLQDFDFDFETTGPLPVKYDLTLNLDGVMNCKIRKREPPNDKTLVGNNQADSFIVNTLK